MSCWRALPSAATASLSVQLKSSGNGSKCRRIVILIGKIFMKDQHCPYLRPQKINTFIGIGSRQREFLDDLLPGDGVDSAVGYHQEQEQVKQRTAETMFIILNRCSFGKNTCQ